MKNRGLERKNPAFDRENGLKPARRFGFVPFLVLIVALAANVLPSTMTLTTVYPAPSGVYKVLITTGGTSLNPFNTILTRDAGNVGIGTASPNVKLDLRGAPSSRVQFTASDGNSASAMIRAGAAQNAVYGSDVGINFRTGASWTNADIGGITVMSLTTGGNVGIGTTSPLRTLSVNGSIEGTQGRFGELTNTGGNFRQLTAYYDNTFGNGTDGAGVIQAVRIGVGYTPLILNYQGGNVGIGTASPLYKLDVTGQIRSASGGYVFPDGTIQTTAAGGGGGGTVTGTGAANYAAKWTGSSSLGTGVIYDNGTNVGIGTTAPGAMLEVAGNIIASYPTAANHVATKAYVDALAGGGIVTFRASGGGAPCPVIPGTTLRAALFSSPGALYGTIPVYVGSDCGPGLSGQYGCLCLYGTN